MKRHLLLTIAAVVAIYVWQNQQGRPDPNATASPVAFQFAGGKRIPLTHAGIVVLSGPGLKNGAMTVHCAKGGFAFGFNRGDAIGLNGFSSALVRQGAVLLGTGERRPVRSTDKHDLFLVGIIEPDADPLSYNRRMDEGLQIARNACET